MEIQDLEIGKKVIFNYAYWNEQTDGTKVNLKGSFGEIVELLGESFAIHLDGDRLPTLFLHSALDKIDYVLEN